ncbi:MAG: PLP-dependent aminotransferase family protein [Clostridiaceae bacterium]
MKYKFTEIMDYLRREIDKDIYTDKLPSIRGLAIKFGCSNSTVIKAYNELETLGLVFSAPKSGYFINREKVHGENKYDFYTGVPNSKSLPLESLTKIYMAVLNEKNQTLLNYSFPMGYNLLREHILKEHHQDELPLESILITDGAQGALRLIFGMPLNGKKILVEDPTYNIVLSYLELNSLAHDRVERNLSGIDLTEFEEKVKTGEIKYFYTMSRNQNPLGTDLSLHDLQEIVLLSRKYGFYIVEDDYVNEFSKGPTFFSLAPDRTLHIRSFSKTVSPTLRIAALTVPIELSKELSYSATYLNQGAALLSQAVLLNYLKSDSYAKDMSYQREKIKQNIMIFKNALKGFPFDFHVPDLGLYASLYFPKDFMLKALMESLQSKGYRFRDIRDFTRQEDKKVLRVSLTQVEPNAMNIAIRDLVKEVHFMRSDKDDKNKIYI